jgi:subtilisin family serine protease
LSTSIACIEWAVDDILKNGRANSPVINMSFGYQEPSEIMVELINAASNQGVLGVAAAGNHNVSYTDRTPGKIPNSFSVAASYRADDRAFYSNWGPGVDVLAPDSDIYSAWVGGNTSTYFLLSGTSMATPHVAGLVAYLRGVGAETSNVSAAAITQRIKDLALKGVIKDPRGSPNLLVNNNSGA